MFPKKLSSRITAWVMVILFIAVISLISGANWITKTFYQNHLSNEVEARIVSHAHLLEKDVQEHVIEYIEEIEVGKSSHLLILDSNINVSYQSENIDETILHHYQSWINENQDRVEGVEDPFLEHVDTAMLFHIPHVWSLMPIYNNDEITGYVFLDQDTGDLNQAQIKLLYLFAAMGIITLIIGNIFTIYLTKRISKPIDHISEMTKNIADGDLDIELQVHGEDEVGRLAANIQSMTKQLKDYRDSRRQFITHISHDLRTPITYIKGYSAVMKEMPPDKQNEWKRNLNVIYQEATRMEHLVSDLFLLTKLEEGKIKLNIDTVYLPSWVRSLYESRMIMFDQKSIETSLVISKNVEDLTIKIDPYRMEQALINIIENAIRHTPNNGKIELSLIKRENEVRFAVTDTGPGIEQKALPYIWDRFYKVDAARSQNDSGTGLGLAIVKEIVEAHGGYVSVESKLGEGTTFSIHLIIHGTDGDSND
ncbi:HAMP domain-containing sensor histidine kinase [Evansella sp. AB-P1]|uniref:HAMP domain-containing sensor histidine kinase n=1 Tax=Evansella sp. AB-P1 TaxID=3037653 RepID=UPI00241F199B|nr:HAMP domain-containing sensor histidine kinase [Evansella sp. AB-P1]MDG5787974.1 HAMP domain-containing sensor histidine kinase [Evansella sp. AB-P1]